MGGNAKAVHRNTGSIKVYDGKISFAEKISLLDNDPDEFVSNVIELIQQIQKESKFQIWFQKSIDSRSIFFGSFEQLCRISDRKDFLEFKNSIGDVDVAIPHGKMKLLHEILISKEEKKITPSFEYVGQNRQNLSEKKLNCIFYYLPSRQFLQIDFESTDFENGDPDPYIRFMRSSPLEDLRLGIKGLAHKYLLACIARCVSYKTNIVVLTNKSPLFPKEKIKIKLIEETPHSLVFSKEGLRHKLEQQFRMGFPVVVDEKYAFKETTKDKSIFEKDFQEIFLTLFSRTPSTKDLEDINSYAGLLRICSRYFSRSKIEAIYEYMVISKLWGDKSQKLSRDSIEEDKTTKESLIYEMERNFPFLVGNLNLEEIMEKYYSTYETREDIE